jgi:hypothetical protein
VAANSGVQIRKPGLGTLDPADQSRTIAVIAGKVDLAPHHAARLAARERLSRQRRQRDHARAAEAAMPLVEFYRRRRGLGELPVGPDVCPPDCLGCRRRSA